MQACDETKKVLDVVVSSEMQGVVKEIVSVDMREKVSFKKLGK